MTTYGISRSLLTLSGTALNKNGKLIMDITRFSNPLVVCSMSSHHIPLYFGEQYSSADDFQENEKLECAPPFHDWFVRC